MSRVIIYNKKTGKVESNMGPMDSGSALRVLGGSRINLNHEEYASTEVEDSFTDKVYYAPGVPKPEEKKAG